MRKAIGHWDMSGRAGNIGRYISRPGPTLEGVVSAKIYAAGSPGAVVAGVTIIFQDAEHLSGIPHRHRVTRAGSGFNAVALRAARKIKQYRACNHSYRKDLRLHIR